MCTIYICGSQPAVWAQNKGSQRTEGGSPGFVPSEVVKLAHVQLNYNNTLLDNFYKKKMSEHKTFQNDTVFLLVPKYAFQMNHDHTLGVYVCAHKEAGVISRGDPTNKGWEPLIQNRKKLQLIAKD